MSSKNVFSHENNLSLSKQLKIKKFENISNFFYNSAQAMRCGNRRKFGADRSKTKLSKNRQSLTSVY
jgi:hypothetical protein